MDDLGKWAVEHHLSMWLIFASLALTSTMMIASGAAMFVTILNLIILFAARSAAVIEGRERGQHNHGA